MFVAVRRLAAAECVAFAVNATATAACVSVLRRSFAGAATATSSSKQQQPQQPPRPSKNKQQVADFDPAALDTPQGYIPDLSAALARKILFGAKKVEKPEFTAEQLKEMKTADGTQRFIWTAPPLPKVLQARFRSNLKKENIVKEREAGFTPCVITNPKQRFEKYLISIPADALRREITNNLTFSNTVYEIRVEGRAEPFMVLPRTFLRDSINLKPLGVTFILFTPGQTYNVDIPIRLEGTEDCIGAKQGGTLVQPRRFLPMLVDTGKLSQMSLAMDAPAPADARNISTLEMESFYRSESVRAGYGIPKELVVDVVDKKMRDTVDGHKVPLPSFLKLRGTSKQDLTLLTILKPSGGSA